MAVKDLNEVAVIDGEYVDKTEEMVPARASEIAAARHCYKIMLATGSRRERTLNFYRKNGFEVDTKHCCIKKMP